MPAVTTLSALREPQPMQQVPQALQQNVQAGFFDLQSFELIQRIAKAFASSTLVPTQYQGNVANTMIALSMAQKMNADPMMVMQNLNIMHGRPAWSSKFLIATFNACGRFSAIRYRFRGTEGQDDFACQAFAIERATGEELSGAWVSISMAKAEGWYGKTGSKWKTMPQHMLMYRAATFMVNTAAPELSMGLLTDDEVKDISDATPNVYTVDARREPEPIVRIIEPQVETDARGVAWDERVHASSRALNKDGTWRKRNGVDQELIDHVERAELAAKNVAMELEVPDDAESADVMLEQSQ